MLAKLIPVDDIPLTLGKKVEPAKPVDKLTLDLGAGDTAVRWIDGNEDAVQMSDCRHPVAQAMLTETPADVIKAWSGAPADTINTWGEGITDMRAYYGSSIVETLRDAKVDRDSALQALASLPANCGCDACRQLRLDAGL